MMSIIEFSEETKSQLDDQYIEAHIGDYCNQKIKVIEEFLDKKLGGYTSDEDWRNTTIRAV